MSYCDKYIELIYLYRFINNNDINDNDLFVKNLLPLMHLELHPTIFPEISHQK
jgi:hypothetical protein